MKKFTKVVLIVAGVFLALGITCITLAFIFGYTEQDMEQLVQDEKLDMWISDKIGEIKEHEDDQGEAKDQHDGNALSNVDTITENCRGLDVEFGVGVLEIKYADVDAIEVAMLDVEDYRCYVEENELHVKGGLRKSTANTDGRVVITIPNGHQFEEVEIRVGAGDASVAGITARELEIEVGAGNMELCLPGSETDYNYDLECGVGTIYVGDSKYSGIGFEKETRNQGADKKIDVSVGAGEVKITF